MDSKTNRQLIEYFKKNLLKGYTQDSLRFALVRQGYSRALVDKAIDTANKELAETAPVIKREEIPQITITEEPTQQKKSFWKRLFGMD